MTKPIRHLLGIGAAVSMAMLPIFRHAAHLHYRIYAASNITPFTIQQHDEVSGPHGVGVRLEARMIALRGDGSRVQVIKEARKGWNYRDISFPSGLRQKVYDDARAVSSLQLSSAEQQKSLMSAPDPASNCVSSLSGKPSQQPSVVLGSEERLGVPVTRILNGGGITVWQPPSLACTSLEHFIDWDPAHPGTNTSALKVDSIIIGEPDAALFSVPVEYTEMLPSQSLAAHNRAGGTPEEAIQKMMTAAAPSICLTGHRKTSLVEKLVVRAGPALTGVAIRG